jgi:hypothetical protein
MNWDNLDWDNFSCVDMMRAIRNEIDAKLANMTDDEVSDYMENLNLKFSETNVSNRLFGMFSDGRLSFDEFIKEKILEKEMEN